MEMKQKRRSCRCRREIKGGVFFVSTKSFFVLCRVIFSNMRFILTL